MDKDLINNSLKIMKEAGRLADEAETPLLINFSGGKDSSTLILLANQAEVKCELIYMTSRLELPGCVDFVRQEADRFGLKLHITDPVADYYGDFPYWVRKIGYFPSYHYSYCSVRLKIRPSRAYLRKLYGFRHIYRVNGVRKSESTRRSKIYKEKEPIRKDWENSGHFVVEPIQNWTGQDVVEYLNENNFKVQKLYTEFGVSGCAYCPFYQVEIYQRILNVYPDIYDEIIKLEDEIGKPSVGGNRFLHQVRDDFLANREEIMARLNEKGLTKRK
jgi:3'-phosphoadenosine 5'-phosphosulfate sulfotransferase (PAPS reductase)/FAD synthetase